LLRDEMTHDEKSPNPKCLFRGNIKFRSDFSK